MKNALNDRKADEDAPGQGAATISPSYFVGTDNPRHLRVLKALLIRPQSRETIDACAGCSNGPDLVAELRRRGLELPCKLTPCIDRDGREVKRGLYYLTDLDRLKVRFWMRKCKREGGAK